MILKLRVADAASDAGVAGATSDAEAEVAGD